MLKIFVRASFFFSSKYVHLFDRFIPLSQFFFLLQPFLYLSSVDVVLVGHCSLIATAVLILVIALNGTQFEIQAVALPLFHRRGKLQQMVVFVPTNMRPDFRLRGGVKGILSGNGVEVVAGGLQFMQGVVVADVVVESVDCMLVCDRLRRASVIYFGII